MAPALRWYGSPGMVNPALLSLLHKNSTKFPTKSILGSYLLSSKECLTFVQADYIFGPISDRTLSTLQLTSAESVFRHVSVQMVDIWNTVREQTLANNLHFNVFLVQVASAHGDRLLYIFIFIHHNWYSTTTKKEK